jgi:uncharacterized protein (DUF2336 family)
MVKPSASNPLDSLVDLACRDGVEIRPTLLRVLTDLYVQKPIHSLEEETQFVELALGLIDAVDPQTRAAVAATLSVYPTAPGIILRKLDGIAAAGPENEPGPHALAELFFSAAPDERRLILISLDATSDATTRRSMPAQSELIRRLENAALKRNAGEFSRVLERALTISRELAERITRDPSGEPVVVAAKALGIQAEVLQRILLFINPAAGQSAQRFYELARLFDELKPATADRMLAIWRKGTRRDPVHAPVHEPVYWNDERSNTRAAATPSSTRAGSARTAQPSTQRKMK